MHVVITGGAGFLGMRLARWLLATGQLSVAGAPATPITRLTVIDRVAPGADVIADARVVAVTGDLLALLQDKSGVAPVLSKDVALVFHLAAAVSGECEADFDLGMCSNLDATRALLEACRALRTRPTVALASPARTVEGLLRAAQTSDLDWGPRTALNLPAIQTTPTDMAAALARVAGTAARDLIDWTPDPTIAKIVTSWPANIRASRAKSLGLLPDQDFESIIRDYVRENPQAVTVALRP